MTFQLMAVLIAFACLAFTKKRPISAPTVWVLLEFTGDYHYTWQVTDETKYRENPSLDVNEVCLGSDGICALLVDEASLSGTAPNRYLNSSSIWLGAYPGSSGPSGGYYAYKLGGSGNILHTYYKSE